MTRILTVDDSRSIRGVITRQMQELGFEVAEAEDGEKGLERLAAESYDLVLLDVTMPVMDGPTMLAKLRERGDRTPVIMLTSESKRTIVAGAMKLGISNYVLKPFQADELRAKVMKALKLTNVALPAGAGDLGAEGPVSDSRIAPRISSPSSPSLSPSGSGDPGLIALRDVPGGARQFVDVLLVDDMENVQKRLRTALPEHVTLNGAVSAEAAFSLCRERVYRVILVDSVIPDVDSVALMRQLRVLQPHATFLALALRTANDLTKDAVENGYSGVLLKPFDPDSIEEFVLSSFGNQELLGIEDNVLRPAPFTGREDRLDRYLQRLRTLIEGGLEQVASACYDEVILDVSTMPLRRDRSPKLLADLKGLTSRMGLELRLVGTREMQRLLQTFSDTSEIPLFASVAEARSGVAAGRAAGGSG